MLARKLCKAHLYFNNTFELLRKGFKAACSPSRASATSLLHVVCHPPSLRIAQLQKVSRRYPIVIDDCLISNLMPSSCLSCSGYVHDAFASHLMQGVPGFAHRASLENPGHCCGDISTTESPVHRIVSSTALTFNHNSPYLSQTTSRSAFSLSAHFLPRPLRQ